MELNKTLTELESDDWGKSNSDSYIEKTCLELRYKPLKDFNNEDLRIMIGQNIGLNYLMPLALNRLEQNPLIEVMHYKGDLLCNVLRVSTDFYIKNQVLKMKVKKLIDKAKEEMKNLDNIDMETFEEAFSEAILKFNK